MNYRKQFMVKPGDKVDLGKIDPDARADRHDKESAADETTERSRKMQDLQFKLYAENKRSLLICLQAMDAGGKDGAIRHVVGPLNPQGTRVHGFKTPSDEEAEHDFLWRIHQKAPPAGRSPFSTVHTTKTCWCPGCAGWFRKKSGRDTFD